MNHAIYLRVSTNKQSSGLEAQERAINSYLATKGITGARYFRDENQSGAKASRPALDEMMVAAREGKISCVVVYSFSRFARSTKHLLEALEEFRKLDVAFVSLTEQIDTKTPMGRATFTIISALRQFERELVSERVKNGLVNAKARGKRLGAPKRHQEKVSLIQHLAVQDLSHREIAKLVGASQSTVSRALRNVVSVA